MADDRQHEGEKKESAGKFKKVMKSNARQLDDAYKAIGVRAYMLYKDGKIKREELEEVASEIDDLLEEYNAAKDEFDRIMAEKKGVKCPYCEAKSAPGSKFCPGCGRELPLPSDIKETENIPCPSCAKPISAGAPFCMYCGKKTK